jgi:hypothetical protein
LYYKRVLPRVSVLRWTKPWLIRYEQTVLFFVSWMRHIGWHDRSCAPLPAICFWVAIKYVYRCITITISSLSPHVHWSAPSCI